MNTLTNESMLEREAIGATIAMARNAKQRDTAQPKHSVTAKDLIAVAHMTNEQWNQSELNEAKPLSEAYDIKNVDIRNLLTVAVGTLSNQTGESFNSALSRGKCADEILRRFKNAERLAEALRNLAQTVECEPKGSPNISAAIQESHEVLAQWEEVQK